MVHPLRMRAPDGSTYRRPAEIEDAIAALMKLPPAVVVERSRIQNPKTTGHIPSECILHFVRHPELLNDQAVERELFIALRQRVLQAVPVRKKKVAESGKVGESAVDLEIREAVLDKFQDLLCADRVKYKERLDFYECRFNMALDRIRATARERVREKAAYQASLTPFDESNEPTKDVELALSALRNTGDEEQLEFVYRLELRAAINSLPPDERRVIELFYIEGMPIESNDGEVSTIVKRLGCTEKTVRNRRDRGLQMLRKALGEDAQ